VGADDEDGGGRGKGLGPAEQLLDPGRVVEQGRRRLPAVLDAQLERDTDLNFFEYTVMAMLSEQPTRTLGMSQLAAVTSASLSRLSNVVKRLERRGYLRRQTDPSDGRCTQEVLSDAGMAKVVETAPGHVAAARHFVIDAVTPPSSASSGRPPGPVRARPGS
jgi:DNA-binding MarR family transcriptional regulator